jgi:hypothetical protein
MPLTVDGDGADKFHGNRNPVVSQEVRHCACTPAEHILVPEGSAAA